MLSSYEVLQKFCTETELLLELQVHFQLYHQLSPLHSCWELWYHYVLTPNFSSGFQKSSLKHTLHEEICAIVFFSPLDSNFIKCSPWLWFPNWNCLSYTVFTVFQPGFALLVYLTEFTLFISKDPDTFLYENHK